VGGTLQQREDEIMTRVRKAITGGLSCAALTLAVPVARGAIVAQGAGWIVSDLPGGPPVSVVIDEIRSGEFMVIQISADFLDPPDEFGILPGLLLDFIQVEPDAVPRIIISNEALTNATGVDWYDFVWQILDIPGTRFNVSESAAFIVEPFQQREWSDFVGPDMAQELRATGGVMPSFGATFFPGGSADPNDHLVIDINVTGTSSFTLKQFPVPEPATMALLALGGAALLRRRVRG
jgi:hypothetical protein